MSNNEQINDTLVTFLSDPGSYPEKPDAVEVRETHMSRVFLTDHYAYKLKKPVALSFLDYSTAEARRSNCEAEVRLNRRFAKSIYLGVVPVCLTDAGEMRIGKPGSPVDWLVKMQRLPARELLDAALDDKSVEISQLQPVIKLLAAFYRDSATLNLSGTDYTARLHERVTGNSRALKETGISRIQAQVDHIEGNLKQFIENNESLLFDRACRVVDGHGDLRPEHVYLGKPPAIIDCIEFNREFRINDPLDEIAFLDMECRRKHDDRIGAAFLEAYCSVCDDAAPPELMAFYRAQRALLRTKLTLWHLEDYPEDPGKWHDKADEYLQLALNEALEPA